MKQKPAPNAQTSQTSPARADYGDKRYRFGLSPYPDARYNKCPICERKTGQRKLPLFIHIEPGYPLALNFTCRYCAACDLLIGNQADIEELLTKLFTQTAPTAIGNEYLIVGTVDKESWRAGLQQPQAPHEMLPHIHPFKEYITLQRTMTGWFPQGMKPPLEPAPPSQHWVKQKKL